MNEAALKEKLQHSPESVQFQDVMNVIEQHYDFAEGSFTNGSLVNASGQNNGSHKLFAFAKLNQLSEQETLACFGDYYRKDVLENPDSDNHMNIRNFMKTGWDGIALPDSSLSKKQG